MNDESLNRVIHLIHPQDQVMLYTVIIFLLHLFYPITSLTMSSISSILGDVDSFITNIIQKVPEIDLKSYECDHVCYRCSTNKIYLQKIKELTPALGYLLVEGMIGSRPISIISLHEPIKSNGFCIRCIEIPCPKLGRPYVDGLEHAEFVIGTEHDDPRDTQLLKKMILKYPTLKFDSRALDKDINADISLEIDSNTSIKFHVRPIYEIVSIEKRNQLVVPVPANYFD